MLSLFAAKSDHPLADAKSAKHEFAALQSKEAADALDDASALLESLSNDRLISLELRCEIVLQMDVTLATAANRFARSYAAAVPASRSEEIRQWRLAHGYWEHLAAAYTVCLKALDEAPAKIHEALKAQLPRLFVGSLHAYAERLKWQQFRYGPVNSDFWCLVGQTYLQACTLMLESKTCEHYPGTASTSPEREYLRILVFQASSMDSLLPQEIELAEHVLAHLLPHFQFYAQERPDSVYWVDALKPLPPTRLAVKPMPAASLRYFSPGQALDAAYALKTQANTAIPPALNLGVNYPLSMVVDVLEHLAAYWSPVPPQRSHVRHKVKSRMAVVSGLASVYRCLSHAGQDVAESWLVEDVSQGGMRALAALSKDRRVSINSILLMQPEGGSNWLLGLVRRFSRENETTAWLGIETLTKQPQALCVDSGGIQTEVILIDAWESATQVRVVIPATAWEDNIGMTFSSNGKSVKLFPDAQIQSGPDYLIGRYRVRVAE